MAPRAVVEWVAHVRGYGLGHVDLVEASYCVGENVLVVGTGEGGRVVRLSAIDKGLEKDLECVRAGLVDRGCGATAIEDRHFLSEVILNVEIEGLDTGIVG